jgi:hypothetical protein
MMMNILKDAANVNKKFGIQNIHSALKMIIKSWLYMVMVMSFVQIV